MCCFHLETDSDLRLCCNGFPTQEASGACLTSLSTQATQQHMFTFQVYFFCFMHITIVIMCWPLASATTQVTYNTCTDRAALLRCCFYYIIIPIMEMYRLSSDNEIVADK